MPSGIGMYRDHMSQPLGSDLRHSRQRSIHHRGVLHSVEMHDVRLLHSARHRTRIPADMRIQLRSQVIRKSERIVYFHHEHYDLVLAYFRNIRIYLCATYHQFLPKRRPGAHRDWKQSAEMAMHRLPSHRIVNIDKHAFADHQKDIARHDIIDVPSRIILPANIVFRSTISWFTRS